MGVRNERGRKNRIYHQGRNGKGFGKEKDGEVFE
jgi:hypothetical protein